MESLPDICQLEPITSNYTDCVRYKFTEEKIHPSVQTPGAIDFAQVFSSVDNILGSLPQMPLKDTRFEQYIHTAVYKTNRKKAIEKYKKKRISRLLGKSKPYIYYSRSNHAQTRKRICGRFVKSD